MQMKRFNLRCKTLLSCVSLLALFGAATTSAKAQIETIDGTVTVTDATAVFCEVGKYVSGGDGLIGEADTWPTMADTPANRDFAVSNIDHTWMQGDPNIIWSFSRGYSRIFASSGIDHGPLPEEALEFTLYGTNDLLGTWERGKIALIYRHGWDTGVGVVAESDDYSSDWVFSQDYKYFKAVGENILVPHYDSDGEFEIDGIAASCVPEPAFYQMGVLLVGGGALLFRSRRRNRMQA